MVAADLQLIRGITKRMEEGGHAKWNHEVSTTIFAISIYIRNVVTTSV